MDQNQDNITTMMESTNSVLDQFSSQWNAIPAFADAVNRVKTGVAAIREKQGAQAGTGDADQKEAARTAVEDTTLLLADQLAALAAKTGDEILAAKVATDKSTLDRLAVSELLTFAHAVKKAAAENSAVLSSDYLIKDADLLAQSDAIATLEGLKTAPRDAIVSRKVATMAVSGGIAFVRGIYRNELDKMMTRFKKTRPDFYGAYFVARIIIDRRGSKSTPAPTPPPGGP